MVIQTNQGNRVRGASPLRDAGLTLVTVLLASAAFDNITTGRAGHLVWFSEATTDPGER
jgi:hypothetical protein